LLVEKDAVQILDDEHVVFVPKGDVHFKSLPVAVGESDARFIEILGGLDEGMEYVAGGAFELKAKIVTGALGGHAGHGH
jgi:cobalt-zinc-cadmium efflux system membrane fusion protein